MTHGYFKEKLYLSSISYLYEYTSQEPEVQT